MGLKKNKRDEGASNCIKNMKKEKRIRYVLRINIKENKKILLHIPPLLSHEKERGKKPISKNRSIYTYIGKEVALMALPK